MFERILVVCTGNICRSPIAEALLAHALSEQRFTVSSAGLGALVGHPADPVACELMQSVGIDISAHRARQISASIVNDHDLILVMESGQRQALSARFPQARGKTYRWGEWGEFDVPDPYRLSRGAFEYAFELIERGLADWLPKLKRKPG